MAHCNNTSCSSATITTLDPAHRAAGTASIAIGADGLGLIAYPAGNPQGPGGDYVLRVAHCDNPSCTSATINPVDAGTGQIEDYVGQDPNVAIK